MNTDEILESIYKAYGSDSGVLFGIKEKEIVKAIIEFTINRLPKTPREDGEWISDVLNWHKKFGVDIGEKPTMIQPARFEMRQRILQEEVDELQGAFWMKDKGLPEVADALCDILYVVIGTAIEFGLHEKLNLLFSEVHRSNMSKLDEHGNPVRREDGKILKSKLWSPPNLESIIKT